jgi:aryl-alcohol dehydrogenase-like predicted oxidoreductase
MKYREIGNTGVHVSEVGFGVWTLTTGWWGDTSDDEAAALLRLALDAGITFFDTADTYGNGRGEEILAKAFSGQRDRVVIATKFGYDFYTHGDQRRGQQEIPQDFSPEFIRKAVTGSLERLGCDYIDLYQLHNPKQGHLERDDTFTELQKLQDEGKIRAWGVAMGPAIGWLEETLYALRERGAASVQIIYNLLEQDPGREQIRVAAETGAGVIVRVPHSSGMLEGKYTADTVFPENDHRRHRPKEWLTNGLKKLEHLDFLTERGDRTIGQAALQWITASPQVASSLPNIYGPEQIEEFAKAPDTPELTAEELRRVAGLYEANFYLERTREQAEARGSLAYEREKQVARSS